MATAHTERSGEGFRPDVQGLRAVAVGLVLLYHFGFLNTTGGYVGVDVFFVISGFVIGGLIFREVERSGKVSMRTFYARRARRILPASTLTIAATVTATVMIFGWIGTYDVAHDALASALFVANYHFAHQQTYYFAVTASPSPLLHFWSLAVEEQFYFIFPSLIVGIVYVTKRRGRAATVPVISAIVVASFIWSVIETRTEYVSAYYSLGTRAWELGVGVLIAALAPKVRHPVTSWALPWVGAVMIVVSAWTFTDTQNYPGWIASIPVLGAALVIIGGSTASPARGITRLLSTRVSVSVGDMSYSLYLWHFPIIALATRYYGGTLTVGQRLGLFVLAIVVSAVSFTLVEQPIRNAKSLRLRPRRSLAVGAVCVAAAVSFALIPITKITTGAATVVEGHPALKQLTGQLNAALGLRHLPSATDPALALDLPLSDFGIPNMIQTCNPPTYSTTVRLCVYGDVKARRTVLLYGNSQAQMWAPAISRIGQQLGFRMIAIAKPACGTFVDPGYLGPTFTVSPICKQFVAWSIKRINQIHPNLVLIATTTGKILRPGADPNVLLPNGRLPVTSMEDASPTRVARDFQAFKKAIVPSGAKIVLMGDVPVANPALMRGLTATGCLIQNSANIRRCWVNEPTFQNDEWHRAMLAASATTKVPLIDVRQLACSNYVCPPVVNRLLVHFDALHMTSQYILYTSSALLELLHPYLLSARVAVHSAASR
jgi:peptidoglycan/LPS O-acetylase OafA/YrhL